MGANIAGFTRSGGCGTLIRGGPMAENKPREPYEPPAVERVKLVRGEMAVVGCKTATSAMGPTTGCVISMCKNAGS